MTRIAGFVCSSLMVTIEKANACSPWTSFCVCLKSKTVCVCRFSPSSSSFLRLIRDIGEFGAKHYFTDHRTANQVLLFVAITGNFSGLFFSEHVAAKGNSPESTYLLNVATCFFAYHRNRH